VLSSTAGALSGDALLEGRLTYLAGSGTSFLRPIGVDGRLTYLAGSGTSFLRPIGVDGRACRDVIRERTGEES
jgi:hypothetical protein